MPTERDPGFLSRKGPGTLNRYRSHYIGHPTRDVYGVEQNTGALGHGLAGAVGIAVAGDTAKTFLPAAAKPAATPTRFCSAMPTSTIWPGAALAKGASLADPRESLVTTKRSESPRANSRRVAANTSKFASAGSIISARPLPPPVQPLPGCIPHR